jgi:hypothetical protein
MTDHTDRVWLRDLDGTGSLHVCAEGDPGAIEFVEALTRQAQVGDEVHLYLGDKTRCGKWLNPDIERTVAVYDCNCRPCLEAYAAEVEGDSDNPERVVAANRIYAQAATLPPSQVSDAVVELRQAIEQRLSKALGGTVSRQFRNRLASDIAALSATNSEAVSELEQIQLLATNHGGWLENDPAKLVADIHKLATAALAKMGRGA